MLYGDVVGHQGPCIAGCAGFRYKIAQSVQKGRIISGIPENGLTFDPMYYDMMQRLRGVYAAISEKELMEVCRKYLPEYFE